jgi:hypothetical protein
MKSLIPSLGIVALALTTALPAHAASHVYVDINPFGWSPSPPPVVYEPGRYYAPPPVVYYGSGRWGDSEWQRNHSNRDWQRNHNHREWREQHRGDWRQDSGDARR